MLVTDIFDKGGIIVWILAGYSFIALTILFERMLRFMFMGHHGKNTEQQLLLALKQGQPETIISQMKGPESRLLSQSPRHRRVVPRHIRCRRPGPHLHRYGKGLPR